MSLITSTILDLKKSCSEVVNALRKDYGQNQSMKSKMIDAWMLYCFATAMVQLFYCIMVGTFPFNSFLAGFLCHVAMFALGASLRYQVTTPDEFDNISSERATVDFIFCHLVLFFVVFSFMG